MASRKTLAGAFGAPLGAALVAGGPFYANRIEPQNVEVVSVSLVLPRLAEAFDGYRVVQISDIHMDGWMTFGRLVGLIELVNEQRPDLIAVTGDFVTAEAKVEGRGCSRQPRLRGRREPRKAHHSRRRPHRALQRPHHHQEGG